MGTGSRRLPSGAVTKNRRPLKKATADNNDSRRQKIARAFEEQQETAAHAKDDEEMSEDKMDEEETSGIESIGEDNLDKMEIDEEIEEEEEEETDGEDSGASEEEDEEEISEDESPEEDELFNKIWMEMETKVYEEFEGPRVDFEHPDHNAYITLKMIRKAQAELPQARREKEARDEEQRREFELKRWKLADGKTVDEILEDIKEYWGLSGSLEEAVGPVLCPKEGLDTTKPGQFYYIHKKAMKHAKSSEWQYKERGLLDDVILARGKSGKPAKEWGLDFLKLFHELAGITFEMCQNPEEDIAKARETARDCAFHSLDRQIRNRITAPARDKWESTPEYLPYDLESTIKKYKNHPMWEPRDKASKTCPHTKVASASSATTNAAFTSSSTGLTNLMGPTFSLSANEPGRSTKHHKKFPTPAVWDPPPPPPPVHLRFAEMPHKSPDWWLGKPRLFEGEHAMRSYLEFIKYHKRVLRCMLSQKEQQSNDLQ